MNVCTKFQGSSSNIFKDISLKNINVNIMGYLYQISWHVDTLVWTKVVDWTTNVAMPRVWHKIWTKLCSRHFVLFLFYLVDYFAPNLSYDSLGGDEHQIETLVFASGISTSQPVLFQLLFYLRVSCTSSVQQFLLASLGTIEQVTILTLIYALSSLSLSPRLRLNWTEHQPGTVHTHTITDYYCNYYYHYYYYHYSLI